MSLLSYTELCELVERGVITNVEPDQINATSIDLTLGDTIMCEGNAEFAYTYVDYSKREGLAMFPQMLTRSNGFALTPGEFILAQSQQVFNLPNDISGEYKLKSSMARIGLEHLNAGWCFVGQTNVPLLDGTEVPIADLVGETPWVYSLDDEGEIVPGKVTKVWETARVTETVVIELDDGSTFECTPDHRIMLRNGQYAAAGNLTPGTSLMPLYRKKGQNGHEMVYSPSSVLKGRWKTPKGRWHKTHVLIDAAVNGELPKGHVVHHSDHNRTNNSPDNLERMTAQEHIAHHNAERNRSEAQKKACSEKMKETNVLLWKDPEYRKRQQEKSSRLAKELNHRRWGTNHKVVSVTHKTHDEAIPVYDMTVDRWHNFALSAGVFVHNCDAGWNGSVLTLELKNMTRNHSIVLRPGDRIGQIVFFRHAPVPDHASYKSRGRYNGDKTVSAIKP